jgi:hypothetical protein
LAETEAALTLERFMLAAFVALGIALFVWPFFGMFGAYGGVPFVLMIGLIVYLFWPFGRPNKS